MISASSLTSPISILSFKFISIRFFSLGMCFAIRLILLLFTVPEYNVTIPTVSLPPVCQILIACTLVSYIQQFHDLRYRKIVISIVMAKIALRSPLCQVQVFFPVLPLSFLSFPNQHGSFYNNITFKLRNRSEMAENKPPMSRSAIDKGFL